jgi:hypothetical protein
MRWSLMNFRMRICRGNGSIRRKPVLMSLRLPQIPHDLSWYRTMPATNHLSYGMAPAYRASTPPYVCMWLWLVKYRNSFTFYISSYSRTGTSDSSVSVVNRLRKMLPRNRYSIPGRDRTLFLFDSVQAGSGTHSHSRPIGTWGCFPEDKSARGLILTDV